MRLPLNRSQNRLPQRLPVGASYVVEGYGGEAGKLRVIARYVVLPGGRRINVAADTAGPTLTTDDAIPAPVRIHAIRGQTAFPSDR